ncbi:chloramphenicol acetyltransferase [Maribacter ulvicola]|uniref:Chloramphenicol O-acetyltransferase type A n=1 Tax=Maribacter ulvicola TaxID=228959 RepID=A0A1N6SMY7_9FLAO|nr:chloramphenicol acetyltransferase [Maribacter ulvicola]SIQ42430.1 chloramphenicol O-acetyltransferase type A [Maribacter ulvicola]
MRKEVNLDEWNRKDHFEFYSQFSEPFLGITAKIDCSIAFNTSKSKSYSFFLYYLHKTLVAANSIDNFRYRIDNGKVYEYDTINASPTIGRENGTFGFSYLDYNSDFHKFCTLAAPRIKEVKASNSLMPALTGVDVIHFSSLPWVDFTSISHARHYDFQDSCPKISFGKMITVDAKQMMSVSVHVHHGLMDGLHVGLFFEKLQELMLES